MKILTLNFIERLRRRTFNAARRRIAYDLEPRRWSNQVLRSMGECFHGSMINVSGWQDRDKQDGFYQDYFPNITEYRISNYSGTKDHDDGIEGSIPLDLEKDLPEELEKAFDFVFTHTVLEHVFDIKKATENLARMARKGIITVVPFIQCEHYTGEIFGDYWRFSPLALKRTFAEHGFETPFIDGNENNFYPIYLISVSLLPDVAATMKLPSSRHGSEHRFGQEAHVYPGCIW